MTDLNKVNFMSYNALDKSKNIQAAIKEYNIVLVPTIIILDRNGNKKDKIEGFIPKQELIQKLEDAING